MQTIVILPYLNSSTRHRNKCEKMFTNYSSIHLSPNSNIHPGQKCFHRCKYFQHTQIYIFFSYNIHCSSCFCRIIDKNVYSHRIKVYLINEVAFSSIGMVTELTNNKTVIFVLYLSHCSLCMVSSGRKAIILCTSIFMSEISCLINYSPS